MRCSAFGLKVVAMGLGVLAGGCTAIAGIEEGVLVDDASTDTTADHLAPAESGTPDTGGPADARPPDADAPLDAAAPLDASADATVDATIDGTTPDDAPAPSDAPAPFDAPPADTGSDVVIPPPCMPAMPGQPCCTTSAQQCIAGYACNSGTCTSVASDVGQSCTVPQHCQAYECLPSGRCTVACSDASDCPPSWSCPGVASGPQLCICIKTNNGVEACDGIDNDCNGQVDDGANAACATSGAGALSQCYEIDAGSASCACPTTGNQCSNDLCADLQNDGNNCGRCGHYCQHPLGGGCANGQCEAYTFVTANMLDGGAPVIKGIAASGMWIYFAYSPSFGDGTTSILRCLNTDGTCIGIDTLVTGIPGGPGWLTYDSASDSLAGSTGTPGGGVNGSAFFIAAASTSGAHSAVIEGVAGNGVSEYDVTVTNGSTVAWLDLGRNGVDMAPAGTTGSYFIPPTYATTDFPQGLVYVASKNAVYFSTAPSAGSQIWWCSMPGCSAANAVKIYDGAGTLGQVRQMVTDGSSLFITAYGLSGAAGGVYAYSLANQTLKTLAPAKDPHEIALDSNGRVFWIDHGNAAPTIQWCNTSGCPVPPAQPNAISIAAATTGADTTVLVADSRNLYWNGDTPAGLGLIQRVELP
jgi:hypothetical protein